MKYVFAWLAWWLGLFWFWFLLVGEWNRQELVAAAVAATIAASLAEYGRTRTGFRARVSLRGLVDLPQALCMVFVDFGIVVWALVKSVARRRVVRGQLVSREFAGGAAGTEGVGARAWTTLVASYSPNAYPIDVDPQKRTVLLHDLVRYRRSESPT